jgi:hypothetical protein
MCDLTKLREAWAAMGAILDGDQSQPTGDSKLRTRSDGNKIRDANFTQAEQAADRLQEIIPPDNDTKFSAAIATIIAIARAIRVQAGEASTSSELRKALADLVDPAAPQFGELCGRVATELITVRLLTDPRGGILPKAAALEHNRVVQQAAAAEIVQLATHQYASTSESLSLEVQRICSAVSRAPFDGKPLIPSYFVFSVLQCMSEKLKMLLTDCDKSRKTLFRNITMSVSGMQRRIEDIEAAVKSPETPQSAREYLSNERRILQDMVAMLGEAGKELKDLYDGLVRQATEVVKVIEEQLAAEKDMTIFDDVES